MTPQAKALRARWDKYRDDAVQNGKLCHSCNRMLSLSEFGKRWDAAMEYMGKRASEGIAHLDNDECCHFQD